MDGVMSIRYTDETSCIQCQLKSVQISSNFRFNLAQDASVRTVQRLLQSGMPTVGRFSAKNTEGKEILTMPLINASNALIPNPIDTVVEKTARCLDSNIGHQELWLPQE